MRSSRIASLTIIALILFAVCCQVLPTAHAHDAMESAAQPMAHIALLSVNLPPASISLLVIALFGIVLFASPQLRQQLLFVTPRRLPALRPPDYLCSAPLQLAIADGILNPKLF